MAANQHVVDELVVKLRLDTKEYDQQEKKIDGKIEKTTKGLKVGWLAMAATAVAGFSSAIVSLVNFEAGLRRLGVATDLSNRSLQAWGSTARRLGGDAASGRQAIADLAREQKTFSLTGSAPTLSALARMGVRAGPGVSVDAMLAQAQQIYRGSSSAQRGQIEAGLSAQGVSDDLILMIKSEKDVREAYAHSYKEASDENRKALDSVTDAMETTANASIKAATVALPAAATAADVFASALTNVTGTVREFAHTLNAAMGKGPLPADIQAKQRASSLASGGNAAQGAMQYLITRHGLSVDQAAGVVANLSRESGLDPNAFNPAGGGQGARGIAQWRGDRQRALLASGALTVEQQLDFMMTDPAERARMRSALGQGGNAGTAISRVYEAHGNVDEDLRRGRIANQMAERYRASGAPTIGQQVNVQNLTVQANNPEQLGGALQRQSGVQNYSAGQR